PSLPLPPLTPTLFPYTTLFRSPTRRVGERAVLFREVGGGKQVDLGCDLRRRRRLVFGRRLPENRTLGLDVLDDDHPLQFGQGAQDRKSTRLNSSHLVISYAVFC